MRRREFLRVGRCDRARRSGPRGSGHRAIGARDQVAADLQLSQDPGDDVRHRADRLPLHRRGDRQQVPHPTLSRRRAGAQPSGARRGQQRLGRVRAHAHLFLCRQGPDAGLRHRHSVRTEQPPPAGVVDLRRRRRDRQRFAQAAQRARHPGRSHGGADGRLVQEGDRLRRRPQGLALAHQRPGRPGARAGRGGAAADPPFRRLRGARAGHDRRCRVHLPPRRREARPAEGGEVQLLSLLVGKRRHGASDRQSREMERSCPSPTRQSSPGLAMRRARGCSPSTMRPTRLRSSG